MHYRILKRRCWNDAIRKYVQEYWTGITWEREPGPKYRPALYEYGEAQKLRMSMGSFDTHKGWDIFLVDPVYEKARIDADVLMKMTHPNHIISDEPGHVLVTRYMLRDTKTRHYMTKRGTFDCSGSAHRFYSYKDAETVMEAMKIFHGHDNFEMRQESVWEEVKPKKDKIEWTVKLDDRFIYPNREVA